MAFLLAILDFIIDVIVAVVEIVIQIVEFIIQLIMTILGFDSGDAQTIEYYEVHNIALFTDKDKSLPITSSVLRSVTDETDISTDLLYALNYTSMKTNIRKFIAFIDNGEYFEGFPTVESMILVVDYDELDAALVTLTGVPCTIITAKIASLSTNDWIKYYLQENYPYDAGINQLGTDDSSVSTSAITPVSTQSIITNFLYNEATNDIGTSESLTINALPPITTSPAVLSESWTANPKIHQLIFTEEIGTADTAFIDERWNVAFANTVYNVGSDNYSIEVVNDLGVTRVGAYTVPSKPLQLHYTSTYYKDIDPNRSYIFVYQAGAGVYLDLDTIETPINIDAEDPEIQAMPAIPLRISNSNFTSFGASKQQQIEDACFLVGVDAEGLLNRILNDPGSKPGDLDNIYVTFGVLMLDSSQIGLEYLYTLCENLFPAQGVTEGTYDASSTADDKPQNNVITTSEDNKYLFQFSYIKFDHYTLSEINADSGSDINGFYYSNLSKFKDGLLVYPYYLSSAKGTYNVGYKADTLAEVAAFLAGNGTVNPGTTTGEATNWLQVTTRMSYNNPSPVLQDPDGTTSDLIYLTGDLVYENNGSGGLRLIEQVSEETTSGQTITYFFCTSSGMDAYTMKAPIAALRVVDGDSGRFNTVKFNLANPNDLMVPFIWTFVKDKPHRAVTELFQTGIHGTIYIAHYEIIEPVGMSIWVALLMIVVIVVVTVFTWGSATGPVAAAMAAVAASVTAVTIAVLVNVIITQIILLMVAQFVIKQIITLVASVSPEAAMVLSVAFAIGLAAVGGFTGFDVLQIALTIVEQVNIVLRKSVEDDIDDLLGETKDFRNSSKQKLDALNEIYEQLFDGSKSGSFDGFSSNLRASIIPVYAEHYLTMTQGQILTGAQYEIAAQYDADISGENTYI